MAILNPAMQNPQLDPLRTPVLDLSTGAQQGIMTNPLMWTSNAPYVRQQIIMVLISAPGLMHFMPNAQSQVASLKQLIETMATKVDGFTSSLSADYDGPVVGNAGEKFESVIKVSRAVSAPNFTWPDKFGNAIARYWTEYLRVILGDPELGVPGIVASPTYIAAGSPVITPEMQSFITLAIEPDMSMTNVTNAWLVTNMQPKTAGEIIGHREKGGSNEVPEVNIEFTALTQIGQAVNTLAKNYLNSLALQDMRPLDLAGFANGIDPDVIAAGDGLASGISASVLAPMINS